MDIGKPQKEYAKRYLSIFSGKPSVDRYHNESGTKHVDVLSVRYYDHEDIVFYSTIGLSLHDFGIRSGGKDLRMELVAAFYRDFDRAGNLLSHCAFDIIDCKELSPNLIIPGIVHEYAGSGLTELWIKFPGLLDEGDITMECDDHYITVLQMLPVSGGEAGIVIDSGGSRLEELFGEKNIDQFDINRKPVA